MERTLYPLFLDLASKPVLVVGAGPVGTQKALALVQAGAAVTVVADKATDELLAAAQAGRLTWVPRRFTAADLDGHFLAVAATGDSQVNAEVARAGAARKLFVNAVDDTQNASAFAAAQLRRGPLVVAISSSGRAPGVARLLRELLEAILPQDAEASAWVARAEALRASWRAEAKPIAARYRELLAALLADAEQAVQP